MIQGLNDNLRLLALLLHYPDERLLTRLEEITAFIADSPVTPITAAAQVYLEYLRGQPAIQVQERYTALFDLQPATTLNVTYHAGGDGQKRAAQLAALQHNYQQAGWERIGEELPDYLPLMLEFLAICPAARFRRPVWDCLQALPPLVARLRDEAPLYAALIEPLVALAVQQCATPASDIQWSKPKYSFGEEDPCN